MSITEIIATIGGSGVFVVILGLIKVKPLEISIWSWIFRKIGKAFNGETIDYVRSIQTTLDEHLAQHGKTEAETNRQRILRFADEMYDNKHHSRESFEDMLAIIDEYDSYCEAHPHFSNGKTVAAEKIIREQYVECFTEHKFAEGQS